MICYETEREAQRVITEINRYMEWRAEKYIKNKATRSTTAVEPPHLKVKE